MRIFAVLDLLGGQVVRGVGGRRAEYQPINSRLAASVEPLDVAAAFRDRLGLTNLYVADLDAIGGKPPAVATFARLRAAGFRLCVDAGLREAEDATALVAAGVEELVFGLETLHGPKALADAVERYGPRVVFSLDLKNGEPLGNRQAWNNGDVWSIINQAVRAGMGRIIVLDLTRVGSRAGLGTESLCDRTIQTFSYVEVIAGGGVRGVDDLRRLHQCGVYGVLIASALHDELISARELAEFTGHG